MAEPAPPFRTLRLTKDADNPRIARITFTRPEKLNAITVGESAEEMLRLALESEKTAVAQFNASAKECHDLDDHASAAVFEEMARDEEKHADWFEGQLDAIERVGIQQYLAQQIEAGEAP